MDRPAPHLNNWSRPIITPLTLSRSLQVWQTTFKPSFSPRSLFFDAFPFSPVMLIDSTPRFYNSCQQGLPVSSMQTRCSFCKNIFNSGGTMLNISVSFLSIAALT